MNKALKKKWVKALRSGKYKQARGTLRDGKGGHCCLGVLCEVAGYVPAADTALYGSGDYISPAGGRFGGAIPGSVPLSRELVPNDKYYTDFPNGATVSGSLIQGNDNGFTFEEIAAWIEEVL